MAVPWDALRVVGLSFVLAAAYEFVVWFLFHRNSSYGRQLEQLDRLGKRLDAAQADAEADPVRSSTASPPLCSSSLAGAAVFLCLSADKMLLLLVVLVVAPVCSALQASFSGGIAVSAVGPHKHTQTTTQHPPYNRTTPPRRRRTSASTARCASSASRCSPPSSSSAC